MRALKLLIGTAVLVILPTLYSYAQSGSSINGPWLGFVPNTNGTKVWPLLGILGAAVPGQPVAFPESITHAAISPDQDYAVATSASGQPVIIRLGVPDLASVPVPGGRSNPAVIAISPTGSSAALYEKDSRVLQIVSGLPTSPQIAYELEISGVGGDVQEIAVSDDASLVLAVTGNETKSLLAIHGNGSISPVSATRPSRIVFIARRPDALVADDATQEVFLLQGIDQVPSRMPGIVLPEGERRFSAVAASADGGSIYVAQEGSEDITIVNLQTRETAVVSCHCTPTGFFPLKGTSVFRLNDLSKGPINVLDASSSSPRTLFIPVDPALLADDAER